MAKTMFEVLKLYHIIMLYPVRLSVSALNQTRLLGYQRLIVEAINRIWYYTGHRSPPPAGGVNGDLHGVVCLVRSK